MFFIAVDPGHTTGIAEFLDGRLLGAFTTVSPHDKLRALLRKRLVARPDLIVVMEQGPANRSRYAASCEEPESIVKDRIDSDRIVMVMPADWKPHPASRLHGDEVHLSSPHERDVTRMGHYYIDVLQPKETT